jgi:hypothetical protein
VSGSSSNTGLVSNSKMVFGGTGANRTVKITPNAGYSGTATISVRVTDPSGATTTDIFVLTVTPRSSTTFAVSNASIVEGHSGTRYMAFTITRSGASTMARVNFATSYGTANRYDFSSIKGTAMFVGSTKEILVPIKGDRTVEPNDTLLLTLSSPSYASITVGSGIGTIVNDD